MSDAAPERIENALMELQEIATCKCGPEYADRRLHHPECHYDSLPSVHVVRDALTTAQAVALERGEKLFAAQARIAELEAALRFYADRNDWSGRWKYTKDESGLNILDIGMAPAMDYGETARRALEAKP